MADTPFDGNADYAIGIALPNMRQHAPDWRAAWEHFTESDAREIHWRHMPLRVEHADGKSNYVGTVEAGAVCGVDTFTLLRVEPLMNAKATVASNGLAAGVYPSLSLSHMSPDVRAGRAYVPGVSTRIAYELSLVETPMRDGADIHHFFPCRRTLERMADPIFDAMMARYYADVAGDDRAPSKSRARYIERLGPLINERFTRELARHRLAMTDVRASAAAAAATMPNAAAAAATTPNAAAAAAATTEQVSPPPPQYAPPVNLRDPLEAATHLVAVEEQLKKEREENARLRLIETQVQTREREEAAKVTLKAQTMLASLSEWLEKNYNADAAAATKADFERRIAENPGSAITALELQKSIFLEASKRTADAKTAEQAALQEKAQLEAKLVQMERERAFDVLAARRNDAYTPLTNPLASFSGRFTSDVRASAKSAPSQPAAWQVPPTQQQQQQQQQPAAWQVPPTQQQQQQQSYALTSQSWSQQQQQQQQLSQPPPPASFMPSTPADVRASATPARPSSSSSSAAMNPMPSESEGAFYYRQAQAALQLRGEHRRPTAAEVAMGLAPVATGDVRASGAGTEPVYVAAATRSTPFALSQQTLCPSFFAECHAAAIGMGVAVLEPGDN